MQKSIKQTMLMTVLGLILIVIGAAQANAQDSGYNSPAQQQIRRDMISNAIRRQTGGGRKASRRYPANRVQRRRRNYRRR